MASTLPAPYVLKYERHPRARTPYLSSGVLGNEGAIKYFAELRATRMNIKTPELGDITLLYAY